MRKLSVVLVLVIAGTVAACSKLYFDDTPASGKLGGPDASPYPPQDAGLPDNLPSDADNGCGGADAGGPQPDGGGPYPDGGGPYPDGGGPYPDGGGPYPDGGGPYADAGPCCPPDATGP